MGGASKVTCRKNRRSFCWNYLAAYEFGWPYPYCKIEFNKKKILNSATYHTIPYAFYQQNKWISQLQSTSLNGLIFLSGSLFPIDRTFFYQLSDLKSIIFNRFATKISYSQVHISKRKSIKIMKNDSLFILIYWDNLSKSTCRRSLQQEHKKAKLQLKRFSKKRVLFTNNYLTYKIKYFKHEPS